MPQRVAVQSAGFIKAREIEMRIGEIGSPGDGRSIAIDRFVRALEVWPRDGTAVALPRTPQSGSCAWMC